MPTKTGDLCATRRSAINRSLGISGDQLAIAEMAERKGSAKLERIRSAIRESYNRLGWGAESDSPRTIPEFRAFYELLQQDAKGNQNVLVRLNELNDYGVFETSGAVRSLLASKTPSVLRIHATQNDGVHEPWRCSRSTTSTRKCSAAAFKAELPTPSSSTKPTAPVACASCRDSPLNAASSASR